MSKYAVLVGINYYNTPNQLYGCINDVIMMRKYLMEKRGYSSENIIILRDDTSRFLSPTRANIINELNELINKANNNRASEIFFHFSGHGLWKTDNNGDESDRRDEFICPVDLQHIRDDELRNISGNLNNNTNMFVVMDCCYSGTNMDLPYLYSQNNGNLALIENNSGKYGELLSKRIFSISGCRDVEQSADAFRVYSAFNSGVPLFSITNSNRSGGALTSILLELLNQNVDYLNVLPALQNTIKARGYPQVPLLSSTLLLVKISENKKKRKPIARIKVKVRVNKIRISNRINRRRRQNIRRNVKLNKNRITKSKKSKVPKSKVLKSKVFRKIR